MKAKVLFLAMVLMCTGCGGNRVSQDMFSYQSLTKEDRVFFDEQRSRQATGGATTKRKSPRWVYIDGVLVDTNNAEWIWNEHSTNQAIETSAP